VALWVVGVAFRLQAGAWVGTALGNPGVLGDWVRATWMEAALLALPILPLSLMWRTPRHRAVFQTWLWAIGYLACLAPTRLLPPIESQFALLVQLGITVVYLWVARRYASPLPARSTGWSTGLGVGLILALPWIATGALG